MNLRGHQLSKGVGCGEATPTGQAHPHPHTRLQEVCWGSVQLATLGFMGSRSLLQACELPRICLVHPVLCHSTNIAGHLCWAVRFSCEGKVCLQELVVWGMRDDRPNTVLDTCAVGKIKQ